MLQALLERADSSMKSTSETSSTREPHQNSVLPWSRFHDRTEGTSWVLVIDEDADTLLFASSGLITGFDVSNLTCAYAPELALREETLRKLQRSYADKLAEAFNEKLRRISQRVDNWDDKGSLKPNPVALHKAHLILLNFLNAIIDSGRVWKTPFVSSDENGHITMQWNNDNQELHIEITQDTEEYIKIWGTNIEHEMHLGILKPSDYVALWDWLN